MASAEHDIRNWLHQLILAIQAVHLPSLLNSMDESRFEGIVLPDDRAAHTDWETVKSEAARYMSALRIGDLSLQVEETTISLRATDEAEVGWDMGCFWGRHATTQIPLHCIATLTNRSGTWKATRIEVKRIP